MSNRRKRCVLAAAALTAALGIVPVSTAQAQATACQWRQTTWELPPTTTSGTLYASDGGRYGVGVTGTRSTNFPYGYKEKRWTLWDNGKVALRLDATGPSLSDVNSAGLMVGNVRANNKFTGAKVSRTGTTTVLPSNPNWVYSTADVINDAGDIAGTAELGSKHLLVVWPANAPGTYRELPTPAAHNVTATDMDEQGRIVGYTDSGYAGSAGFVTDLNGQVHKLAAQGANGMGTPSAIRDGRVVGDMDNDTSYAAAEWNAQGSLVRTITKGALSAEAIGGNGTVGGLAFVGSNTRPRSILWRDGVVSDSLSGVSDWFMLKAISDDEKTLIGDEISGPAHYTCS
ncbi:hypothetical protein [Streptomyces sp. NPDC054863]